jgi:hypothetical protein
MLSDTNKGFRNFKDSRRAVYLWLTVTLLRKKTLDICVEEQHLYLEKEGTQELQR